MYVRLTLFRFIAYFFLAKYKKTTDERNPICRHIDIFIPLSSFLEESLHQFPAVILTYSRCNLCLGMQRRR